MKKKQKLKKRKISRIVKKIFYNRVLFYVLLMIAFFLFFLYNYIYSNFSNITLEQLIYSINNSEGTDTSVIIQGTVFVISLMFLVLVLCVLFEIGARKFKAKTYVDIQIKHKKFSLLIFPWPKFVQHLIVWLFFVLVFVFIFINMNFISFFYKENSLFIKDNYIYPTEIKITAPEEKQNLIYIYVESMEATFMSSKNGGAFDKAVTPGLESLAQENINFSHNEKIGGADMVFGSNWTIAGMVAQTAGVPLKLPLADYNTYSNYDSFLPGAYSIGQVLQKNNYHNYLMLGSNANFGGRRDYFSKHGDYIIYDYEYAKQEEWIPEYYKVWWGFEDKKLFKYAKKSLLEIANNDEPLNYTILTANTHFYDGYVDKRCERHFDEKYLNSFNCSDSEISEFVEWVKKQDFYENTTIIIVGDHLTMQSNIVEMFDINNPQIYDRKIYNVFINSKNENMEHVKNRSFNSFDLYPTTLSALGFEIEGDRLGLGTNLFSDKKTLTEEFGFKHINKELAKNSTFYNKKLLGNTYQEMLLNKTKKGKDS